MAWVGLGSWGGFDGIGWFFDTDTGKGWGWIYLGEVCVENSDRVLDVYGELSESYEIINSPY